MYMTVVQVVSSVKIVDLQVIFVQNFFSLVPNQNIYLLGSYRIMSLKIPATYIYFRKEILGVLQMYKLWSRSNEY